MTKAGGGPAVTGSVRFFLCQPAEVTANGCEGSAGTVVGADIPLAGGGANVTATSEATSNTTAIGKYCWRAEYLGDFNYSDTVHTDAGASASRPSSSRRRWRRCRARRRVTSHRAPGDGHGDVIGWGQPADPTGTVRWFLCQPNEVTAGQGCVAGGTEVLPSKPLNPFGIRVSSGTTTPSRSGSTAGGWSTWETVLPSREPYQRGE